MDAVPKFRRLGLVTVIACIAMWLDVALSFIAIPLLPTVRVDPTSGLVGPQFLVGSVYTIVGSAAMWIAGASFLTWMSFASANALRLQNPSTSSQQVKTATVNIIGAWLIPILNFYKPYRLMRDIWRRSDSRIASGDSWESAPVPKSLLWWWLAYFISTFTDAVSGELALPSLLFVNAVLRLVAALLATQMMRAINERQQHKLHLLMANAKSE